MKMIGNILLATGGIVWFANNPSTAGDRAYLSKVFWKALGSQPQPAAQAEPQTVVAAPADTPAPSGGWMWQDRSNPLNNPAYDGRVSSGGASYTGGAIYYGSQQQNAAPATYVDDPFRDRDRLWRDHRDHADRGDGDRHDWRFDHRIDHRDGQGGLNDFHHHPPPLPQAASQ